MSRRTVEGQDAEFTCAVMTHDAVGPAAEVHNRMPIVLTKVAENGWLNAGLADGAEAIRLARDSAITDFVYHAVNPRVNNSRSEGAELIEPFEILATGEAGAAISLNLNGT
jgi:putative SOS response-associated peptidase YedK